MSWPELISTLLPQRVHLVLGRGSVQWQPLKLLGRAGPAETLPLAPATAGAPAWQACVDAVQTRLNGRRTQLHVQLADRFVRYQHLPWRADIGSHRERLAWAGHRFREIYGEAAAQWSVTLNHDAPGRDGVACAIDRDLLQALLSLDPHSHLQSLQPAFVARHNALRRQCRSRSYWFALVEPARICLALFTPAGVACIRNESCSENWPQALTGLLRRMALQMDAEEALPLYVSGDLGVLPAPLMINAHPLHVLKAAP